MDSCTKGGEIFFICKFLAPNKLGAVTLCRDIGLYYIENPYKSQDFFIFSRPCESDTDANFKKIKEFIYRHWALGTRDWPYFMIK